MSKLLAMLAVCVLALWMATATSGLECYACSSIESAEECEKQQTVQRCVSGQDQCLTLFLTYKTGIGEATANTKSCADQGTCDLSRNASRTLCTGTVTATCSFSCCKGDFCNSGAGPTPKANKCYMCSSEKSWEDCENTGKVITCPFNQQGSCAKAVLEGKRGGQPVKIYAKDCVATSLCHPDNCKLYDRSLTNTTCDLHCCTGDLCNEDSNSSTKTNAAKVPMVSAIILLTWDLIAVFR